MHKSRTRLIMSLVLSSAGARGAKGSTEQGAMLLVESRLPEKQE